MNTSRVSFVFAFSFVLLVWVNFSVGQQKYNLKVPGTPSLSSVAEIKGNTLTITRPGGKSYTYTRQAAFDTTEYQAYYGASTKQFVRFPLSAGGKKMQLGRLNGTSLAWNESQMQVWKAGGTTGGTTIGNGGLGTGGLGTGGTASAGSVKPAHLSFNGTNYVAFADGLGKLQLLRETNPGKWQPQKLSWNQSLVPSAGIGLVAPTTSGQLPGIVSINSNGQIVHVINGQSSKVLLSTQGSPDFLPGSSIAVSPDSTSCFVCDKKGSIWEYSMSLGKFSNVELRPNLIAPGGNIAAFNDELLVIGKQGNLAGYKRNGNSWSSPYLIATGFHSGGTIASWQASGLGGGQNKAVASVDKNGNPQVLVWENQKWNPEILTSVKLSPGAPVGIGNRSGTLLLSFVDSKGNWVTYRRGTGLGASWTPNTLSGGFATTSPVLLGPNGVSAFSINTKGQLMAARFRNNSWNLFPFQGALGVVLPTQRIISSETIPNPPLLPVEIVISNDHKEPLVVRVYKRGKGNPVLRRATNVKLAPGQSTKVRIERDSGAVRRQTIAIAGALGSVQKTSEVQVPPANLYDVVVYEDTVTSKFFDRTKPKSKYKKTPDSVSRSLTSVGVFPIPAGPAMSNGSQLQAYSRAVLMKNPGGAALFGPIKQ